MRPNYWSEVLATKGFKDVYRHTTINTWKTEDIWSLLYQVIIKKLEAHAQNACTRRVGEGGGGCPLAQPMPSHSPGAPIGAIPMTPDMLQALLMSFSSYVTLSTVKINYSKYFKIPDMLLCPPLNNYSSELGGISKCNLIWKKNICRCA